MLFILGTVLPLEIINLFSSFQVNPQTLEGMFTTFAYIMRYNKTRSDTKSMDRVLL